MNALEKQLLELVKRNAENGMSALIDRYTPLVYTIVKNKLSSYYSVEDIEETVSDVFVAFYNSVEKVDLNKGSISAYLSTLAKRKASDRLRRKRLVNTVSIDDENELIEIPDSINVENELEKRELAKRLTEVINALGEPDSTIVYRKFYLFESSAEIANYVGLSSDNVRQRLSRALKIIKTIMEGDYYENQYKRYS